MYLPWVKMRRCIYGLVVVAMVIGLHCLLIIQTATKTETDVQERRAQLFLKELGLGTTSTTSGTPELQLVVDKNGIVNPTTQTRQKSYVHRFLDYISARNKACLGPDCDEILTRRASISCPALMEGDAKVETRAQRYMKFHPKTRISDKSMSDIMEVCENYLSSRKYYSTPVTEEEREFPIAFTILVHENAAQVERLFRAIYREQNVYCLHVDAKADDRFKEAMRHLVRCFPNVIIASKLETVLYASFSRLQAERNCMQDLMRSSTNWRYLINLTGQEFPLKTNRELVKILTIYNGANDIEGVPRALTTTILSYRYEYKWEVKIEKSGRQFLKRTTTKKPDPPSGLYLIKGSAYGVFSRAFLQWTFDNSIAREFLNWTRDTYSPDEIYWATLNHNARNPVLNPPGGYPEAAERKSWVAKFSLWSSRDPCHGKTRRGVCIFGIGDLPNLISRKELFANKFYWDFEYIALDCMEEWLFNKTINALPLDVWYYKNLPFVKST